MTPSAGPAHQQQWHSATTGARRLTPVHDILRPFLGIFFVSAVFTPPVG